MTRPIAFVSRCNKDEEAAWIAALSAAMPQEVIRPFSAMDEKEKQQAEIAIAANPDPADLAALPHLEWLHSVWAGVDTMVADLRARTARPLPLVRLVDPELTRTMAEAVLAWVYYLQRDMPAYRCQQQMKQWRPLPYRPPSTIKVGLLGLGELGRAAAKSLLAAGFQVQGWSRTQKANADIVAFSGENGLETVLQDSDIAVLLLPLTAETRGLMNDRRFAAMKKGAALLNFARGPIVEAQALLAALAQGRLSHAVLDVFSQEPLPETCPYWHNPQITVLPHVAAPTNRQSAAKIVAANIARWKKKRILPACVDINRGY